MPRYLTIVKGSETHEPPPPALFEAMDRLMKDAGDRLVSVGGLRASGKGARARIDGGRITVTDGPFTEAKEVIGGFAIYDLPSLDEAKEWTRRFLQVHVDHFPGWDCEVEVREMMDDATPGSDECGSSSADTSAVASSGAGER